jgi:hypothetical protein
MRQYGDPAIAALPPWPLSDGEIHFLYWFIQGSIMIPETRQSLRRGWGFCERRAWAVLAVELCYRPKFQHSTALLYQDLVQRAVAEFAGRGPLLRPRLARRLASQGRCRMCDFKTYHAGRGGASPMVMTRGRQTDSLFSFAAEHRDYWDGHVCGVCRGDASPARCRRHLIADPGVGDDMIDFHETLLSDLHNGLRALARSYEWGHHGSDRPQDRAALVSAVGFMGGWRPLLTLFHAHTAIEGK